MGYFQSFIKVIMCATLLLVSIAALAQSNMNGATELSGPNDVIQGSHTINLDQANDSETEVDPQQMEDQEEETLNNLENKDSSDLSTSPDSSPSTY